MAAVYLVKLGELDADKVSSHCLHQALRSIRVSTMPEYELESVAAAVLVAQLLQRAHRLEPAVGHDGEAFARDLALVDTAAARTEQGGDLSLRFYNSKPDFFFLFSFDGGTETCA